MDYGSELRQRFSAPARAGDLPGDAAGICEGAAEDRSQRFWVRFQIEVRAGTIGRARFRVFGCPHGIAAADCVAGELEGRSVEALLAVDWPDLARRIGMPREKFGKLLRIEEALAVCHAQALQLREG